MQTLREHSIYYFFANIMGTLILNIPLTFWKKVVRFKKKMLDEHSIKRSMNKVMYLYLIKEQILFYFISTYKF